MGKPLNATNPETGETFSFDWNRTDREPDAIDLESIYKAWKGMQWEGSAHTQETPLLAKMQKFAAPVSDQAIGGYLDTARNAVSRAGEYYAGAGGLPGVGGIPGIAQRPEMMDLAVNKPDEQLEPPGQMLADAAVPQGTFEGKGAANVGKGLVHGAARVVGGFADPENLAMAPLLGMLPARVLQIGMALVAAGQTKEAYDLLQAQGLTGETADKAMQALGAAAMAWIVGPKKIRKTGEIMPESMRQLPPPPGKPAGWNDVVEGEVVKTPPALNEKPPIITPPPTEAPVVATAVAPERSLEDLISVVPQAEGKRIEVPWAKGNEYTNDVMTVLANDAKGGFKAGIQMEPAADGNEWLYFHREGEWVPEAAAKIAFDENGNAKVIDFVGKSKSEGTRALQNLIYPNVPKTEGSLTVAGEKARSNWEKSTYAPDAERAAPMPDQFAPAPGRGPLKGKPVEATPGAGLPPPPAAETAKPKTAEERAAQRIAARLKKMGKNANDVLMIMLRDYPAIAKDSAIIAAIRAARGAKNISEFASSLPPEVRQAIVASGIDLGGDFWKKAYAGARATNYDTSVPTGKFEEDSVPGPVYSSNLRDTVNAMPDKGALHGPSTLNFLKKKPGVTADEMSESGVEGYLAQSPKTSKGELLGKVEEGTPKLADTRYSSEYKPLALDNENNLAQRYQDAELRHGAASQQFNETLDNIFGERTMQRPNAVDPDAVRGPVPNSQVVHDIVRGRAIDRVRVTEANFRQDASAWGLDLTHVTNEEMAALVAQANDFIRAENELNAADHAMANIEDGSPANRTRWDSLKLPGGEKYQENLQKLSIKTSENERLANGQQPLISPEDNFMHQHWADEANVLLHERFDHRTDAEGKSGVMLHEMQSDWHQQGQKKGYKEAPPTKAFQLWLDDDRNAQYGFTPLKGGIYNTQADAEQAIRDGAGKSAALVSGSAQWQVKEVDVATLTPTEREVVRSRQQVMNAGRVPDAPFKKDEQWTSLGLKRMVREVAEQGHDRVYWPSTPEQVAKIEGWGSIQQGWPDGPGPNKHMDRWFTSGRDVTPIVNRYLELMPRLARDLGKKFGAAVGKTRIDTDHVFGRAGTGAEGGGAVEGREVFYLDIPDSLRTLALTKGLPLYGQPMNVPQKKALPVKDSERGMMVADLAIGLAEGANTLGKKLGKVYRASLAGGIRTAESNAIQGLGRFGITALTDAVAAVAALPFSTRMAKSFGSRAANRIRLMTDFPTIMQDVINSAMEAGTGKKPNTQRANVAKEMEGLTKTFLPGELDERMWHYFGGAISVPGGGTKPVSGLDKVTRTMVAPNIIQDRTIRLMVLAHELMPIMKETGSATYTDLARKAMANPALNEKLTDALHSGMTEALSVTAGLPPMSGALKDFTAAVHKFGWSWLVDPFFDYALHQAPQQFLESAPILNLLSKRIRESLNHPELKADLKSAMTQMQTLEAQHTVLRNRVNNARGLGRASLKAQLVALEQQMHQHNEEKVLPLKGKATTAKHEGRYTLEQMVEHAMIFAPMAALFYAIRVSKGEDNTDFHQKKDKESGKLSSGLAALGPYAPWALLGDMIAREQMKSKYYESRHTWPFMREFLVGLGQSRFPDAPSARGLLDSLMADDTTKDDTRMELANKWAASVGRAFGKLGLYGDIARGTLSNDVGDKVQGNPGVLLPGDKPLRSAGARGFMNEQAEAIRHGFQVPPKYDSSTGEKELKDSQMTPFPSSVKMDSKVSEFLRAHQSEISPKDVYFKATGIDWYDKAATDYLKIAIKNRVEPLIDDTSLDEATKVEAVKTVMARVRDTAHVVARKEGASNDLPLPPRIARMAADAEEREEMRKAHPEIFKGKRKPAGEKLLKPEKRALQDKGKKQMEEPPSAP